MDQRNNLQLGDASVGAFFVLDGLDGAGKTTQLDALEKWLLQNRYTVVRCRDPGGTPIGERLRSFLLDSQTEIGMTGETLLYLASRAELVEKVIRPALGRGAVVLCDRFESATLAYQGHAGGVDVDAIRLASQFARGDCLPDWTGILDLSSAKAEERLSAARSRPATVENQRAADRIEQRASEYHDAVRRGFRLEAARDASRWSIIDADRPPELVHQAIVEEVARVLANRRT